MKKNSFTKDMLEEGMRVKTRCGTMYIKIGDTLRTMTGYIRIHQYSDDLRNMISDTYDDIMEVYADTPYCCDPSKTAQLLWKREEQTEQQKRILELEENIRKAQEQIRELMEEELYSTTIM